MLDAFAIPDVYAAEAVAMTGLADGELMARAVAGLVEIASARLRAGGARRVVALVGPGNNGGDALYAAASLARAGFDSAAVYLDGKVHRGALAAAIAAGVVLKPVRPQSPADAAGAVVERADLILDGIVGIGGRPGLPDFAQPWVASIADTAHVLAVDLPSGQDPMGEKADPAGVWADETLTFSLAKPVHLLPSTEAACGLLTIIDIGIAAPRGAVPWVRRLDRTDVPDLWPVPGPADDKYSRGVVGIIAGGENYTGAAVLACTAAVNAGVGMVRYVGTPTPEALVRAAVPEAVHGVGQVQAWVVGPGLDAAAPGEEAGIQLRVVRDVLASDARVVIDAGGLDLVTGPRPGETVLTPHAGEAARLLTRLRANGSTRSGPVSRHDVTSAPRAHARELAERLGAVVLLKGATTLVTAPGVDTAYAQSDAPSWLATAGAGDVLAGLLGALAASRMPLADAAALAALVHGVAADDANPGGPVRALAVANALPQTIARLLRTA
ncbi:MAG: NAD(P)H-hydrate dehydratase [Dermatophilaceae bacterium]